MEQQIIDHEVRLSQASETLAWCRGRRQRWSERHAALAEQAWYRAEVASMLSSAATQQELQGLGLTDGVVREAGLGRSLVEAWKATHPARRAGPPLPAPRTGERPARRR